MSDELSDVVVVGAGPAGAAAAILLARSGHRVVLLERERVPGRVASAGWLSARAVPLLTQMGVTVEPLLDCPFHDVTFYNADLSKQSTPAFKEAPGFLIDRTAFATALVETASGCGVTVTRGRAVVNVILRETSAVVRLDDGADVEGRLLILAAGTESDLVARVGISLDREYKAVWCAQADAPKRRNVKTSKRRNAETSKRLRRAGPRNVEASTREDPGVDDSTSQSFAHRRRFDAYSPPSVGVVLGLDQSGSFGFCCVSEKATSVSIHWMGDREEAVAALVNLCRMAATRQAVPLDLSKAAASATLTASPAGAALDMESHVAKHTLVIGDAGGFVAAGSDEGVYPALWSAQIAAEVAEASLKSAVSQDELMTFDSKWRLQMADYLRAPHTDIQFLIPLIFTNQPMADRMGAAFFSGENI